MLIYIVYSLWFLQCPTTHPCQCAVNQSKGCHMFASLQLRDSGMLIPRQVFVFCRGSAHVKLGYWHVWGYWAPYNGCKALQGTFEVVATRPIGNLWCFETLELRWILWEIFRLISMLPSDLCHVLLTSFYVHCCCPWQGVTCLVQDIADIYEKEENVEKAMEYYDKAAELYSGEGTDSTANQCKIKVAQFAAQLEQCASIPSLVPPLCFLLSVLLVE